MSIRVFSMIKRVMKFMVRNLLWGIRIMERWLETIDGKDTTYRTYPIPSGKGKGQAEETKEKAKTEIPEESNG